VPKAYRALDFAISTSYSDDDETNVNIQDVEHVLKKQGVHTM
jgi:hypothetical protein